MIYNLYKKRGETPLQCIERFKEAKIEKFGDYCNEKMTYLGRLDPLAEGVLLIASGEDTNQKSREEFFELDKAYDFVCIFGFATDSYDILGKVLEVKKVENINEMDLIKIAKIYEGEREQKYPKYSSKMIARTLKVAKSGSLRSQDASHISLQEHSLPLKKVTIHKIQFHKLETLNSKELFGRLLMDISKVTGDFRQNEILTLWKQILLDHTSNYNDGHCNYFLGRFSAEVSSGTYIRSLVNDIGKTLGCGATTLSIKRTRVGDFKIKESLQSF